MLNFSSFHFDCESRKGLVLVFLRHVVSIAFETVFLTLSLKIRTRYMSLSSLFTSFIKRLDGPWLISCHVRLRLWSFSISWTSIRSRVSVQVRHACLSERPPDKTMWWLIAILIVFLLRMRCSEFESAQAKHLILGTCFSTFDVSTQHCASGRLYWVKNSLPSDIQHALERGKWRTCLSGFWLLVKMV